MKRLVTLPESDTKPTKNNPLYLALPQSNFLSSEKLIMVGSGQAKTTCGNIKFGIRCSNFDCENPSQGFGFTTCYRLACPVCRDTAIRRLARSVSERIEGMYGAYSQKRVRLGAISHVQISTDPKSPDLHPDVLSTVAGYNNLLKKVYKLLRENVRDYGGVLIFHPWRQVGEDSPDSPDKKKWEWSPHFHYLGWGYFRKADDFYRLTGWTYSKIGQGVKVGQKDESRRSIYGTAYYQLTHCGIFTDIKGRHQLLQAVRYVGMLSPAKGGYVYGESVVRVNTCDCCGSDIHRYRLVSIFSGYVYGDDWGRDIDIDRVKVWYLTTKSRYRNKLSNGQVPPR